MTAKHRCRPVRAGSYIPALKKPKPSGEFPARLRKIKPLFSVCAARTLKMSSCLRMPVAPGTSMPLAMEVSFEMDISLRSARFRKPSSRCPSRLSFSGASAVATLLPPLSSLVSLLFALKRVSVVVVAYKFSIWCLIRVAAFVKGQFPLVTIWIEMRIGAGSTADYRMSEPITARQRFLLNEVLQWNSINSGFSCASL